MKSYLNKFSLKNKVAFVIGGLGLIGREVSIAFASAGAKTIVLDLLDNKGQAFEEEMKKGGYDLVYKHFDCTKVEKLDKSFVKILDQFNCPDIFINCSYPRTKNWGKSSFKDITLEAYRNHVDIFMNTYAWLARLAAETMVKRKKTGSIIQLGSTYGVVGQDLTLYEGTEMQENMAYAAIKGGITNLTRLMSSYYGQYNIRVNTLCPGGLEGHVAGRSYKQSSVFIEKYNKKTPLKRLGKAEEIASVALFLASDAASYLTGSTIMVDGGWTAI